MRRNLHEKLRGNLLQACLGAHGNVIGFGGYLCPEIVRFYDAADGLGDGRVTHLRFGPNGGLWASTEGGLSRIKDGHIATLAQKNGLPCDEVHWSMEDEDHVVWLYMPCGLVRIARSELDAWINDPKHVLKTTVFDI